MSETWGECRSEMEKKGFHGLAANVLADAIDRLAADVAVIKAKVEQVAPEDVLHFVESEKAWVKLVEEQRDAAIRERDEARAEVERLKAELAARPADGNSPKTLDSSPAAPQPAAPPPRWLTEEEKRCLPEVLDDLRRWGYAKSADVVEALLSRAGSPPVVEVPAMVFGSGSYQMQKCYRAAMDRAGVKWKEVGRE